MFIKLLIDCSLQLPKIPEYYLSRKNCEALSFLGGETRGCKNKATFTPQDLIAYRYTFMRGVSSKHAFLLEQLAKF